MTLYEWCVDALKDVYYLWDDVYTKIDPKTGAKTVRNVTRERKLAISIINSQTVNDFYTVARQVCPPGTIIEPIEKNDWNSLFADKTQLVFMELTKSLLDERFMKSAKVLMDILTKRLASWKESKNIEVTNDSDKSISINIIGV